MKTPLIIALPALAFLTACGGGGGHENFTAPPPPDTPVSDSSTATPAPTTQDPQDYWTEDRMKNAQPAPMPEVP
ncbi:hypothetical protein [uncultured Cardiobacterium sp.]|uniref:hypothetical protein n=1 Tax=uncultured Cardiobacterium sp. TaxID=417619 RepID=UPI0026029F1D|nr:hypothetical protein [uncultured Cardiobacterium sp.]